MRATSLLCLSSLLCSSLQASLRLDPDRSQFFKWDSVSLICEDSSGDWTVRRNTSRETRTQCGEKWATLEGSLCKINALFLWDTGRYWCESREGQTSDSVNITVKVRGVVLQVPVLPVTEGQTVSLSCRHHTSSNLPARFHRDGHFLWEEPTGHMTLQQVSASDEGLYQCEIRGETSESSWIRVRPVKNNTVAPLSPSPQSPLSALSLVLMGSIIGSVLLVLLVLLVLVVRQRQRQRTGSKGDSGPEGGGTEDVTNTNRLHHQQSQSQPIRHSPESEQSPVYSTVKTQEDLCYSAVTINSHQTRGPGQSLLDRDPEVIYSSVKVHRDPLRPTETYRVPQRPTETH